MGLNDTLCPKKINPKFVDSFVTCSPNPLVESKPRHDAVFAPSRFEQNLWPNRLAAFQLVGEARYRSQFQCLRLKPCIWPWPTKCSSIYLCLTG